MGLPRCGKQRELVIIIVCIFVTSAFLSQNLSKMSVQRQQTFVQPQRFKTAFTLTASQPDTTSFSSSPKSEIAAKKTDFHSDTATTKDTLLTHSSSRTEPDVDRFTEDLSDENSLNRTTNCPTYFQALQEMIFQIDSPKNFSFNYPSEETAPAKMAFSYVVHKDPGLFEILLHLTFRPYNSYCIYIDYKASEDIKKAYQSLVDCYQSHFPNTTIFVFAQPAEVYWGHYTLLNADLRCLEALYEKNSDWDYYANLAGTELPVTTVETLATKLSSNHINISVESFIHDQGRWKKAVETISGGHFITSGQKLPPAPYNLQPCKGMKNAFLSRSFADFAIHHDVSQQFRLWVSFTNVPDETFFPSLARIKNVQEISPQNYNITLDLQDRVPYIDGLCPRYSKWADFHLGCDGKYVSSICHITIQDLKDHLKRNQLENGDQHCYVINKVDVKVDTKAIHYLAQQLSSFDVDEHLKTYKPFVYD